MSVRAFVRDDLGGVADLYQRIVIGEPCPPPERLTRALERSTLDHPWADPDLPSLVYEDSDGAIVGFQAGYVRRLVLDERPLLMVCVGQLVADPDAKTLGIGGLLLRSRLAGPQDITITDGATAEVRDMWRRLGGTDAGLVSVGWTRVFRPGRFAGHLLARRRGHAQTPGGSGHLAAPSNDEELTPERLVDQMNRSRARLRPAYDVDFLAWLFDEMEAVEGRGPLARRVVRDARGREAGWYVAYLPSTGIAQAIGLGSVRPDPRPVLDRLFADARAAGASAVRGRIEPSLLPALTTRRCLYWPTEWALAHYADEGAAAAAGREQALITRLDGEWWMGYHLGRRDPYGSFTAPTAGRTDGREPRRSPA